MAHHVLFIPGLSDHRTFGQNIAIQVWRLFGLRPHYFALRWDLKAGYDVKMQRLHTFVKAIQAEGHTVSLVGASAGASAVLNAYASFENIHRVVYICGKINRPLAVSPQVYASNPDFEQSMRILQQTLQTLTPIQKHDVLNLHPYKDRVVPYEDTRIAGVQEITLPGWSHAQGIFSGILLGAPYIARHIRNKK